jgi:hypothetical protein
VEVEKWSNNTIIVGKIYIYIEAAAAAAPPPPWFFFDPLLHFLHLSLCNPVTMKHLAVVDLK